MEIDGSAERESTGKRRIQKKERELLMLEVNREGGIKFSSLKMTQPRRQGRVHL